MIGRTGEYWIGSKDLMVVLGYIGGFPCLWNMHTKVSEVMGHQSQLALEKYIFVLFMQLLEFEIILKLKNFKLF